ncbi:hypothetical protein PENSPDRAFT_740072 [Peniophora sp. CONT]|nr:hypothetical protein PENSPDRAFT_740072 [Peniophora sp. CONT]
MRFHVIMQSAVVRELQRVQSSLPRVQFILPPVQFSDLYEVSWTNWGLLPSLRHMRLDGVRLPTYTMRLPKTLYSLELSLIEPSQRKIQGRKDDHRLSALELLNLVGDIGSIIDLQRLAIDFSDAFHFTFYRPEIDPSRTTILPHLREITLTTQSENLLNAISCAISLPALRRCVLSLHYNSGLVYRGFRGHSIKGSLQSAFRNFIAQLSSSGVHLHTLCLAHRRSASGTTTTSIIACADPIDWTDTYVARHTLSQNANLQMTLTCDIESPATSRERINVVEAFLGAFLSCPAPDSISDALPITSLALSINDDTLSKLICEKVFLGCLPHVDTIACYDGHEEVLVELHARSSSFPDLQMLITPEIGANQEARAALDAILEARENMSHLQVDEAAACILRNVVMRAAN